MKFTWYEEPQCSWGHFQLNKAMRQAGFSSRIPPAVGCQGIIYRNLMGRLCKEKGACVALAEQSSIHQPDFLPCKWVVCQGALRRGTGEKWKASTAGWWLSLSGSGPLGTTQPGCGRSVLGVAQIHGRAQDLGGCGSGIQPFPLNILSWKSKVTRLREMRGAGAGAEKDNKAVKGLEHNLMRTSWGSWGRGEEEEEEAQGSP